MALNLEWFYFFNNLAGRSRIFDDAVIFFAAYLQYFIVVFLLLFLYLSAYSRIKKIYIFLLASISGIIARFGLAEAIRFFYHHPRPFVSHSVHQLLTESGWSFPSGHSSFFFALATAIYFYDKKWGIGFFIAAIFMNVSRIIAGIHYPFDILGGMLVGIATAYLVVYLGERFVAKKWRP